MFLWKLLWVAKLQIPAARRFECACSVATEALWRYHHGGLRSWCAACAWERNNPSFSRDFRGYRDWEVQASYRDRETTSRGNIKRWFDAGMFSLKLLHECWKWGSEWITRIWIFICTWILCYYNNTNPQNSQDMHKTALISCIRVLRVE